MPMFQTRNSLEYNEMISLSNSQHSLCYVPTAMCHKEKACCHNKTYLLSRRVFLYSLITFPAHCQGPTCNTRPTLTYTPNILPHNFTSQLYTRETVEGRKVRAIHNVNTCDAWLPEWELIVTQEQRFALDIVCWSS